MKLFIASHSQPQAKALMEELATQGHQVVSRWITADTKFGRGHDAYTDAERSSLSVMDEADVRAADALVLIAEAEGRTVPGGKHVETGIAIALQKRVFVLGRKENIFHWHPSVHVVNTIEELIKLLGVGVSTLAPAPPTRRDQI